jgi:small subunit ribosomal protein S20
MPRIKSAKKALKQSIKRRLHNVAIKTKMKSLKKAAVLSMDKKETSAPEKVKKAIIAIDKAAKIHLIHENKAARMKSRLAKKLNELKMVLPKKVKKTPPVKKSSAKKVVEKKKPIKKSTPAKKPIKKTVAKKVSKK